ncbi:MAG TPA: hypothetical protein VJN22_04260 [Candidatus Eremiobacteraceae bacterium]|nr:hypothetical protein [Candidatus Eremiobacteraceae bacterium]
MTPNTDILLFTYALIVVGLTIGAQMVYVGSRGRAIYFAGRDKPPVLPVQLQQAGIVFTIVGVVSFAAMVVEILSGAAGTNIVPFIVATFVIPPIVLWYNARAIARI